MSIHCLSYVMRHSEAQLGARLVLFVLAEHAHDDGSNAFPTVPTIAERTRLSRRAVQSALRRLEGDEMIRAEGLGPNGQTNYRVFMGGADSSPLPAGGGEVDDARGRSSRRGGGEAASPNPSVNPSEPDRRTSSATGDAWEGVPDEMRQDALEALRSKMKVGGRLVTEGEARIAAVALAEFNRQGQSDFGFGAHVKLIVARVRERPSWDASKHVRLVQSAWRVRWWERSGRGRRATPQVIYGNTRVFEQVAQDAADEAAGRRVDGPTRQGGLFADKRFGGRSWEELTAREQENAKEAVAMSLEPWDGGADAWSSREAPVLAASSNGHGPGLTAATFLEG